MKQLEFSVSIRAAKAKVWGTLWQDKTFRDWADIIDPGTYMLGELKEGNEVQFISSSSGYGVTSLIERLVPSKFLQLRHRADTEQNGGKVREAEWTGGRESYSLAERDQTTTLTVVLDVPENLVETFNVIYPKVLARIKEFAELEK